MLNHTEIERASRCVNSKSQMPAPSDDVAHIAAGHQSACSHVVAQIRELWAIRQSWVAEEVALILRGTAICRRRIAKRDAVPHGTKLSKEQLKGASELFYAHLEGWGTDDGLAFALEPILRALRSLRPSLHLSAKQLKVIPDRGIDRDLIEDRLKKLVRELPAWSWVEGQNGFGEMNFAGLVGEAGDIGNYRNPSCFWKRMGLAVIDGQRQRCVKDAELAIEMGYAPHRHAVAYVLSSCLLRAGEKNPFREVYDRRKEAFAPRAKSKAHAHNDAQRVMVKRALRELWSAWRGARRAMSPDVSLPLASLSADEAGPTTIVAVKTRNMLSSASIPVKTGKRRPNGTLKPNLSVDAATIS